MGENHSCGIVIKHPFDNLSGMNTGTVNGPVEQFLIAD